MNMLISNESAKERKQYSNRIRGLIKETNYLFAINKINEKIHF